MKKTKAINLWIIILVTEILADVLAGIRLRPFLTVLIPILIELYIFFNIKHSDQLWLALDNQNAPARKSRITAFSFLFVFLVPFIRESTIPLTHFAFAVSIESLISFCNASKENKKQILQSNFSISKKFLVYISILALLSICFLYWLKHFLAALD